MAASNVAAKCSRVDCEMVAEDQCGAIVNEGGKRGG